MAALKQTRATLRVAGDNLVLTQLSQDLLVWQRLSERYEVDLFCGLFMGESNEGLPISAKTLRALGERGIKLDLDIYAPDRDE